VSSQMHALPRTRSQSLGGFEDDLLVPVGRKMVLTPLAEALSQPVRQLLVQAEAIIHRIPHFSPKTSQRQAEACLSRRQSGAGNPDAGDATQRNPRFEL
jgi:hypothetical protein